VKPAALALLVLSLPVQAQMYKCVDERGHAYYRDQPGTGCKSVDIRPSPPLSGEMKGHKDDLATQDAELKRRQLEREAAATRDREARAALDTRCASLRRQNSVLASGVPIVNYNDKGERVYMEDAERERRRAELAEQLRSCP
jgi:uncharacterized protein DUF4124